MVSCRQCVTLNTLDSAYCRKCGVILLIDDVEEAQLRLDKLVADGITAFNEGRTDEALAVAETALDSNPTMVSALSLAADVFVRRGDLATALDYADKVVDLNPDSDLDRIRRNQLRGRLQDEIRVAESPDRRNALVAAIASVVLVGCFGILGARYINQPKDTTPLVASNSTVNDGGESSAGGRKAGTDQVGGTVSQPTNPVNTGQPLVTNPAVQPVNNGGGAVDNSGNAISDGDRPSSDRNFSNRLPLTRYNGGTLPDPTAPNMGDTAVTPLPVTGPTDSTKPTKPKGDPDPIPDGKANNAAPVADPEPDPGEISIQVRKDPGAPRRNSNTGGSVATDAGAISDTGLQALVKSASQQFQAGNLTVAASTYERALAAGGDPISTNQRLGMIYDRLGRNGEAINAYNRVISAAQSALNSGSTSPRIQNALETAKQAVKALGG
jgi:tetratricopeptide (TPR) repeat protein